MKCNFLNVLVIMAAIFVVEGIVLGQPRIHPVEIARMMEARKAIAELGVLIDKYHDKYGEWPSKVDDLAKIHEKGQLPHNLNVDPWKRLYQLRKVEGKDRVEVFCIVPMSGQRISSEDTRNVKK